MASRISIRPHVYRGRSGFLVYGTDAWGRKPRIFCKTRQGAEEIKAAYKELPFDHARTSGVVDRVLMNNG